MPEPSREEIDRFLQKEYEVLIRILKRKLNLDDLEAVDLAHEAVMRIYDLMPKYDATKGNLQAWSRGILKFLVLQFREGRMRPLLLTPNVEASPDRGARREVGDAVAGEISEFILSSVHRLPEIYREVVRLRYVEGLDLKEISRKLKIPLGTVKARLSRAPKMLQDALRIQETTARFYLDQLGKLPHPKE